MTAFFQNVVNALQWGSFYALIALGYSMVYGVLLLFNFAHGDIFMVGAYIGFFVATGLTALLAAGTGLITLPMWAILILSILITMFLTSFLGMAVERIGYRPLRNAPRASAAITGLMIGIILETGILAIFGAQRLKFPDLMAEIDALAQPNIAGVIISWKKVMIVGVAIGLMILLQLFVSKTKWGMAMRAMAYDFAAVPLMGVPLNRIASLTFALGSALAAAAAVLYSVAYPVLDPYMGITVGWKAFVAAILGGRGSIKGAAIAGFMLGFIEIFSATLFPSTYRDLIAYSIILAILVFRPHGLFGEAHTSKLRL
jgi:branched-chain amino acid transport system permease protein